MHACVCVYVRECACVCLFMFDVWYLRVTICDRRQSFCYWHFLGSDFHSRDLLLYHRRLHRVFLYLQHRHRNFSKPALQTTKQFQNHHVLRLSWCRLFYMLVILIHQRLVSAFFSPINFLTFCILNRMAIDLSMPSVLSENKHLFLSPNTANQLNPYR